jgi:hypothetical protein
LRSSAAWCPARKKAFTLPAASFVVYPRAETYSVTEGVKAIGLTALLNLIAGKNML